MVCVSWCVCKCAKPGSGEGSSSGESDLKSVDGYANAVQATFCGTLASVVCVSGKKLRGVSVNVAPVVYITTTLLQRGIRSFFMTRERAWDLVVWIQEAWALL